jgi:peptide/nickel transport system permease protein
MSVRGFLFFIGRRLLASALLLVAVSFLVFSLLYLAPGNPIAILLGTRPRTPQLVAYLTREYNLDKPFLVQYWLWAKGAIHFRFGNSIQTTVPVTQEIEARLPTSVFLGVYAFVLATVMGVGLGIVAAVKRRTMVDRTVGAVTIVTLSTPGFATGIFLLYVFAVVLQWFPTFGKGAGFVDELWHLSLPAIALALATIGVLVKYTRASMIEVFDQDYVTFAKARGLSSRRVLFVYVLRNALIPLVTIAALVLASFMTGAVFIETVFSLSGLGSLLVGSATEKDIPILQALALMVAVAILSANLIADLLYMAIDPRMRRRTGMS